MFKFFGFGQHRTPKEWKIYFMNLIWNTLAKICKFFELIIEAIIWLLTKFKDGIYFVRDWLEERELLG